MSKQKIPFFRPEITATEISAVTRVLKSGWLNTGAHTARFQTELQKFTNAQNALCVSSCWAGMFVMLQAFGVGLSPKDEVIVPNLTFTATASCVLQCGAKLKFADIEPDGYHISPTAVQKLITKNTKAIIAVDYGGYPANHATLLATLTDARVISNFKANCPAQEMLGRPLLMVDAAHSIGSFPIANSKTSEEATPRQKKNFKKRQPSPHTHTAKPMQCDVAVYSFHTVKNITTGDGGAITVFNQALAPLQQKLNLLVHHGLSKTAFQRDKNSILQQKLRQDDDGTTASKPATSTQPMPHRYDVLLPGYKFNLTDIEASLGLSQLQRIAKIAAVRNALTTTYTKFFAEKGLNAGLAHNWEMRKKQLEPWTICPHLYTLRLKNISAKQKIAVFEHCTAKGIALNEHYKPLSEFSVYSKYTSNERKVSGKKNTFSESVCCYNENISLPFYNSLTNKQALLVGNMLLQALKTTGYKI